MKPKISCVVIICGKVCGTHGLTSMIYQLRNQTYKNIEIIPITCCTERLGFVKEMTKIDEIQEHEHCGTYEKCNEGIEVATGDYIGFFSGDDCYMPNYLEKMVELINQNDADLVFCDFYTHYREDGSPSPASTEMGHHTTGSFLLRSSIAKKYRIPITVKGDTEFIFEIIDNEPKIEIDFLHEPLYLHR